MGKLTLAVRTVTRGSGNKRRPWNIVAGSFGKLPHGWSKLLLGLGKLTMSEGNELWTEAEHAVARSKSSFHRVIRQLDARARSCNARAEVDGVSASFSRKRLGYRYH
jgi:hypothetical protein